MPMQLTTTSGRRRAGRHDGVEMVGVDIAVFWREGIDGALGRRTREQAHTSRRLHHAKELVPEHPGAAKDQCFHEA